MGLVTKDLNNINLDNDDLDKDDSTNTVFFRLITWCNNDVNKHIKRKIEGLMPRAWHSTRVWDWCMEKYFKLWNDNLMQQILVALNKI